MRGGRGRARPSAADGTFVADEVLAKHDEKYMPPEVARSLKQAAADGAAQPEDWLLMLPELGHFALILALLLAGLQAFFGIVGSDLRPRSLGRCGDAGRRGTVRDGGDRRRRAS